MKFIGRILFAAWLGLAASASARDLVWDGNTYLDIGLQLGADTTIVFAEPVEFSAENVDAFAVAQSMSDPRILSIRPQSLQEQRVTFIGRQSKTIYLARFSTRSTYAPLYRITDGTATPPVTARATGMTPTGLMRMMMAAAPAQGVTTRKTAQALVTGTDFTIRSTEVWETPGLTGVMGTVTMTPGLASTRINPADIALKIPSLGQLRMMGADIWDLTPEADSGTVYFVFSK